MKDRISILNFIESFRESKQEFLNGKCFWFSYMLKELFGGTIYYSQVDNHFACKIDDTFYDASGIIDLKLYNGFIPFSDHINLDIEDSIRIYRDCILFEPLNACRGDAILFLTKFKGE